MCTYVADAVGKTGIEYECLVFDDDTECVSPKYHGVSFFLCPPYRIVMVPHE